LAVEGASSSASIILPTLVSEISAGYLRRKGKKMFVQKSLGLVCGPCAFYGRNCSLATPPRRTSDSISFGLAFFGLLDNCGHAKVAEFLRREVI
jgi:hypothetical protein